MKHDIEKIKGVFEQEIKKALDSKALEDLRVKYLGRKSELRDILESLKSASQEQKREVGSRVNILRKEIEETLSQKMQELGTHAAPIKHHLDITRPGRRIETGRLHPLSKIDEEIRQIFLSMNFSVVEGPEIEEEFYNFDALNIPANHPAREMWDTFWLKQKDAKAKDSRSRFLLRTHTSPVQIRYLEQHNPPFQIIAPGRVFRYEATDASHEINFYQIEGLMVGKDITLANFKYVIEQFFKKFFKGQKIDFRFRPSYFPFVEPGVEVDIKLGSTGKWLEVMGAGMVHRNVFKAVGYNPDEVQGFAFGMGMDRLAVIKHKIPDVRLFYSGDERFVRQFK